MSKTPLNKNLKIAGWIFLFYGIFEMFDVVTAFLAIFGVSFAKWPTFLFSEINEMFVNMPFYTFLFALVPTFMRLMAGIGILKNRQWGFGFAIIVSIFTLCVYIFYLPLGVFDAIFTAIALTFLLIGYFEKKPIKS